MSAQKQPYPAYDQPPGYSEQANMPGVGPPMQGFAPPPGAPPPPGPPPPGAYPPQPPMGAGYPAAPPGGYVAGQPIVGQPTVTVTHQPVVMISQQFRHNPVNTVCPHCSQNIITSTNAEPGGLTWLLCVGICLFGFWLGCCLIPFCIPDLQDIRHSCPNCKNTIHVYRRM